MKTVCVRYQVKPEFADENQRLVEQVFAQLARDEPAGLRYQSYRLADGVSFMHIASRDGTDGGPLETLVRTTSPRATSASSGVPKRVRSRRRSSSRSLPVVDGAGSLSADG